MDWLCPHVGYVLTVLTIKKLQQQTKQALMELEWDTFVNFTLILNSLCSCHGNIKKQSCNST